ncbi:MAG: 50S ribosomal protein L33 [Anaeroplasmataceae bacterium]
MREKVILVCEQCLSRNYNTTKNKSTATKRLEFNKYCTKCNKYTLHKESK